jgi:hypothetical protein
MNPRQIKIIPDSTGMPPAPPPHLITKGCTIPPHEIPSRKPGGKANGKRDQNLVKDSVFTFRYGDTFHVISENYSYKTETYYTILQHELEGKPVRPASAAILDAYVVPVCLERAKLAGIPVCCWGISQAYVPLPAILYGLNYFATTSDYFIVRDNDQAKEVIKHITNKGKYPFCYQKLDESSTIHSCVAIFGKTTLPCPEISLAAQKVYEQFSIPLVTLVFVKGADQYYLSSLAPVKYSHLKPEERALLVAHICGQGFL